MSNVAVTRTPPMLLGTPINRPRVVVGGPAGPVVASPSIVERAAGLLRGASRVIFDSRPAVDGAATTATLAMRGTPVGLVPPGTTEEMLVRQQLGLVPGGSGFGRIDELAHGVDPQSTSAPQVNQTNQTGLGSAGTAATGGQRVENRNVVTDDTQLQGWGSPWGSASGLVPYGSGAYGASMTGAYGLGYTPFDRPHGGIMNWFGGLV